MHLPKLVLTMLLSAAAALPALAEYPTKPVRVLVGFPAGQTTDVVARMLGQRLTAAMGQSFFVENKPGVGAGLAAEVTARADADGYTILATSSGPLTVNPWIYPSLKYDSTRDFEPIGFLGLFPLVLVVNARSPFNSVEDLVRYARQHPGKVNYASGGNGVTNHLAMEMFRHRAGIDLTHVPYKGGVAALTDLAGGQVDVMFEVASIVQPLVRQGKLKPLAVASQKRIPTMSAVPTIGDSGYPGFQADAWIGVVAPRRVPAAISDKLATEIARIVATPDWQAAISNLGAVTVPMSRKEFGSFIASERTKWGDAVKRANVRID
ncbi:tripartite tricarboxylate transporter substrate binding protein [Cupriavidus sp. DF5525]|uniref:Bug family tripartite tricarboxylate transporter substrate binding protein n=1 Tax=Cupriavidus sp. DF5525 TaxID=3160989 RepID=UPI0032DF09CE